MLGAIPPREMGSMIKRVLFAGGGTGGHIFMAVALARELEKQKPGVEVLFVGARKGIGNEILPALGFRFQTLNIGGFKGVGLFRAAVTLLQIPGSLLSSRRMIRAFSPSVIVGLGGYSSGPIMLVGKALGFPGLLIEPNVQPGFTNRVLKHWVDAAAEVLWWSVFCPPKDFRCLLSLWADPQ